MNNFKYVTLVTPKIYFKRSQTAVELLRRYESYHYYDARSGHEENLAERSVFSRDTLQFSSPVCFPAHWDDNTSPPSDHIVPRVSHTSVGHSSGVNGKYFSPCQIT
ncbi:hypothetical protein DMUE_0174 [Dictyocoela muelleri]|nr:hypothetical protein DMUE_0174 [Dictyocoela muelleri]